jgi:pimeloyl-ACP methyl ester carboxylesterase
MSLLSTLAEVFPFDADRIVLIGEGHGASGVVDLAMKYPKRVRGLVLVNATGGLASPQLRTLRELPILAIAGHSPSAKQSIDLLQIYAKSAEHKKLEVLQDKSRPWCLAVPMAARQIEAFGRRVTK